MHPPGTSGGCGLAKGCNRQLIQPASCGCETGRSGFLTGLPDIPDGLDALESRSLEKQAGPIQVGLRHQGHGCVRMGNGFFGRLSGRTKDKCGRKEVRPNTGSLLYDAGVNHGLPSALRLGQRRADGDVGARFGIDGDGPQKADVPDLNPGSVRVANQVSAAWAMASSPKTVGKR
jgi:hypothetical protein